MNKAQKYTDAWEAFNARNDDETAQAPGDLRFTNFNRGGAPKISTFGMCLSGAFSKGAMEIFTHLAKEKFPGPPTPDNPSGTYSYRIARHNGFSDWWMRICQRNVFNCVAKSIMSGIRICKANAPTAWTMQLKFSKWNPLGTTHKRYELILRMRVIYNIRAINQHHEHLCKTCLIIHHSWCQILANFKQLRPLLGTSHRISFEESGKNYTTETNQEPKKSGHGD